MHGCEWRNLYWIYLLGCWRYWIISVAPWGGVDTFDNKFKKSCHSLSCPSLRCLIGWNDEAILKVLMLLLDCRDQQWSACLRSKAGGCTFFVAYCMHFQGPATCWDLGYPMVIKHGRRAPTIFRLFSHVYADLKGISLSHIWLPKCIQSPHIQNIGVNSDWLKWRRPACATGLSGG